MKMFTKKVLLLLFLFICQKNKAQNNLISLVILGIAQDGGSPQIGCDKSCCKSLWKNNHFENVTSIGLVDNIENRFFLIDASPDIPKQYWMLKSLTSRPSLGGILLTHAHTGHYSGLLYLGKESLGARNVNVYSMPKMTLFLKNNGPWSQLVQEKNIKINMLKNDSIQSLGENLSIKPILVPHRDEFSETVGYLIKGRFKSALFLPDIDKWEKWDKKIEDFIRNVDYAFIDGTFYDGNEIPHRNMNEIPHPFVVETLERFKILKKKDKKKVYFIHLNHTNPLLKQSNKITKEIIKRGYNIARTGMKFDL
mgnify:FL=1